MKFVTAYIATGAVFLVCDMVWLGLVAKGFYRSRVGGLLLEDFNLPAALAFYLIYLAGVMLFAALPAFNAGSWKVALAFGAAFGFFAYATYDLTNLATLRGWSVSLTIVDIAWGAVLTGTSATLGYLAAKFLHAS